MNLSGEYLSYKNVRVNLTVRELEIFPLPSLAISPPSLLAAVYITGDLIWSGNVFTESTYLIHIRQPCACLRKITLPLLSRREIIFPPGSLKENTV